MTRSFYRQRILLSLGCFSIFLALTGCTPNVSEMRARGIEEYRNERYVESMATLRYALDQSPSDAKTNYYMGMNYRVLAEDRFQKGDAIGARKRIDSAIYYFTQAINSWPNYMAAVAAKNESFESRGKYDAALDVAEVVAQNNKGIGEHYIYLANEYRQRGDYDNALKNYNLAIALNPNSSRAYEGLGKLYRHVNDRPKAINAFRRAKELNPNNTEADAQLAELNADSDYKHAEFTP